MIETYGKGRGESKMWESVAVISDAVEKEMDEKAKDHLMRKVYCVMSGGHYNEEFAKEDVAKMYYTDMSGNKHYAPYFSPERINILYNNVHFCVTMNMIESDYAHLVSMWFPDASEEEKEKRYVELALNWLEDEDNPFGQDNVWKYFNSSV